MIGTGLEPFVPFPKQVLSDRKSGKITPNEYELYMFVRHGGNPYGVTSVSLEGLLADFAHHRWKDKNYVNKLLLSLKRKRYLHYDDRVGHRGSFEVHFSQFATPDGHITRLHDDTPPPENSGLLRTPTSTKSEVHPSITPPSPRLNVKKEQGMRSIGELLISNGRASYTETDTNKRNNRFIKKKSEITPTSFVPTTHEEEECKRYALELGEASMRFLLGKMHTHGFDVIEGAWGVYCHDVPDKSKIRNKRAYFNKILTQRIEELGREKTI